MFIFQASIALKKELAAAVYSLYSPRRESADYWMLSLWVQV